MGKSIYRILLCLVLGLGLLAGGSAQAAELEGPWHYYEFTGAPFTAAPNFARQNVESWPLFDLERRPLFKQGTDRLLLAVKVNDTEPQKKILLFLTAKQAVRMWLGDEYFFSAGSFQPQRFDEGSQPYMVHLPEFSGQQLLVIELYAHAAKDLGWFSMFSVDTEQVQMSQLFFSDIPLVIAIPVGLAIIFIMFLYYYFNPQGWKRLYAYITLFMTVFVFWCVSASNVKSLFGDWPRFWWYMLSIFAYLLPITSNLVLLELLKGKGEGFAIYWCIQAAREGDALCKAVLFPTVAFTLLGLFDGIAGHYHLLPWRMYLTPLGAYAFLYFVICILREQVRHEESLLQQTAGLEQEVAVIQRKSETDALTGCYNRNKLKDLLAAAIAKARKKDIPFGMLMLDIDFFKKINDNYGHDTGDAVLRGFATVVRQQLDKDDPCVRWGGEEFLVLVNSADLTEIKVLAEKIRQQVEGMVFAGHRITCSIGITLWQNEKDTAATLFKRADGALYQAKNNGRNCVVVNM